MTKPRPDARLHIRGTLAERFWARVDRRGPDECWPWLGATTDEGYGKFSVSSQLQRFAHVLAYVLTYGEPPEGTELDHTCHTRAVEAHACAGGRDCPHRRCVNPRHVSPVTHSENVRRGARAASTREATHCKHGHEFTPENTYVRGGHRSCVECGRRRSREHQRRRRARSKA